jgi:hypothetical protein
MHDRERGLSSDEPLSRPLRSSTAAGMVLVMLVAACAPGCGSGGNGGPQAGSGDGGSDASTGSSSGGASSGSGSGGVSSSSNGGSSGSGASSGGASGSSGSSGSGGSSGADGGPESPCAALAGCCNGASFPSASLPTCEQVLGFGDDGACTGQLGEFQSQGACAGSSGADAGTGAAFCTALAACCNVPSFPASYVTMCAHYVGQGGFVCEAGLHQYELDGFCPVDGGL